MIEEPAPPAPPAPMSLSESVLGEFSARSERNLEVARLQTQLERSQLRRKQVEEVIGEEVAALRFQLEREMAAERDRAESAAQLERAKLWLEARGCKLRPPPETIQYDVRLTSPYYSAPKTISVTHVTTREREATQERLTGMSVRAVLFPFGGWRSRASRQQRTRRRRSRKPRRRTCQSRSWCSSSGPASRAATRAPSS